MTFPSICSLLILTPFLLAACGGSVTSTSTEGTGASGGDGGAGGDTSTAGAGGTAGSGGDTGGAAGMAGMGGAGGAGGATGTTSTASGPGDCPLLTVIQLSDGKVVDAGGDGKWSPGEAASVNVTMTNPTKMDVNYPGITCFSSDPLISSSAPYNAFFVLFAGASMPIDVGFTADAAAAPGTKAEITCKLTDIQNNVCEELPSITINVTLE